MDGLTGIMLSETSQTEKDKYCITYTWTLKIQQTSGYQWGEGMGERQDRGRELRDTN